MKFSLSIFLTFIALTAAHAQTDEGAAKPMAAQTADHCTLVHVTTTSRADLLSAGLLLTYVANVDGLLRDLADKMTSISEQAEAGELTPAQAQEVKLETARVMIGRLETISAVYEAMIFSGKDVQAPVRPDDSSSEISRGAVLQTNRTVSVDELSRETAQ